MPGFDSDHARHTGPGRSWWGVVVPMLVLAGIFIGLGTWQVQRLWWKEALIARVDARVQAAPVDAPAASEWEKITRDSSEYRHIRATGIFLNNRETLVATTTELGMGFWVITPLVLPDHTTILINRGFVPAQKRDPATRPESLINNETTVTGLLRFTEPEGTLLRRNEPAADRWYSRDVQAIAQHKSLSNVAPFFIDADRASDQQRSPRGSETFPRAGLTRIQFSNNHLSYALTWYAMAIMTLGTMAFVVRNRHSV